MCHVHLHIYMYTYTCTHIHVHTCIVHLCCTSGRHDGCPDFQYISPPPAPTLGHSLGMRMRNLRVRDALWCTSYTACMYTHTVFSTRHCKTRVCVMNVMTSVCTDQRNVVDRDDCATGQPSHHTTAATSLTTLHALWT